MAIDASIYGLLKQQEAPDILGSANKAMNLKSLAMQQGRLSQETEAADRAAHLEKAATFGQAMKGLAAVPEDQRPQAYLQVRDELLRSGVATPDKLPEQYDKGTHMSYVARWDQTAPAIKMELEKSQTAENYAQAKKYGRPESDPMAKQLAMLDARDKMDQQKKQREIQQYSQVGGFKLADGSTPTADDAKKFKAGAAGARALLSNLNEYQNLVDQYGSEAGGKVAQRMDSLVRDIQLAAKNEDLYDLGVLTGPDLSLLEEVVGSAPTGITSKLNPWSASKASNKAQQFRELVNSRVNAKAKTYGFEPQDEWKQLAAGGRKAKTEGDGFPGTSKAVAREPSPEDMEAMHWLQKNADNPKAAGVRSRLQKQGLL
jgi:hypothetical protein